MKLLTVIIRHLFFFAAVLWLWPCVGSHAKPSLKARFYSAESGLGTGNVRSIVQDEYGYLWLGTTNGLMRYDGYRTMMLTPDDTPRRRLMLDSRIQSMRLKDNRYLLLRLRGGKHSCYDTWTDSFIAYDGSYEEVFTTKESTLPTPKDIPDNRTVKSDNRGNTIVTTPKGEVWHIDAGTRAVTHISGIYSEALLQLNGKPRINVLTDADGLIWISTYGNGLFVYDRQTGENIHYTDKSYAAPIQTVYLTGLYEDKGGNIWVCQENMGVACITKQHAGMETVFFTNPEQTDHTNSIRLLTNIGSAVYVGNLYNGTKLADGLLNFQKTLTEYHDDVLAVCRDKQQRVWVGTRKRGIFVDGTLLYNPKTAEGKDKKVSDIICDQQGRLWISFFDGGVDMIEADGGFRHFFAGPTSVRQPRQLMEDHAGYIWLTSNEGVYVFQPDLLISDSTAFRHISICTQADEIRCITETPSRHILLGTQGSGMAEMDNSIPGQPQLLRIWNTQDGMPNDNIQQLITDDSGKVWIGTDHGLARYDADSQTLITLLPSASVLGNMFVENAACQLDDGRLAFGTYHGIFVISPNEVGMPRPVFGSRITDIDINGTSIAQQEDSTLFTCLAQMKALRLEYSQNSLTFYFSDFEYSNEQSSKYWYRLSGYDRGWLPLSGTPSVSYKNLPPGHYALELKVQGTNGDKDEQIVSLPIIISPPLWRTWWAYLIYICIAVAIGYFLWRNFRRINDLRTRIKVEKQLTEYKMQFFTNISHEFRTPLTIIRGAMERMAGVKQMPGDLKQPLFAMQRSTERMVRMIGELMEFNKLHNDKLRLAVEETEVVAFVRDIFSSFTGIAETKHINYQFATTHRQIIAYIDRSFIDKIVYNLVSNSFKYTPAHHDIKVKVRQDEGDNRHWEIAVEDTGIGIPKEKQADLFTRFNQSVYARDSIGIGLHLTGELVRVHHGTIVFCENEAGGCIFTVMLPMGKEAYAEDEMMQVKAELSQDDDAEAPSKTSDYQEMPPIPINKRTVLIVEDDGDVRSYLQNELQQYFVIRTANDGKEALEQLSDGLPDLVLTDAMMPVMDGFELIRRMRGNSQWADLPIVMLTALTAETDQLKGLKTGAEAYIQKPFSNAVLITTICKMIEQRDRLKLSYAKEVVGTVAPPIITEEADRKLHEQLDAWMQAHIDDPRLTIDACAEHFGYGRTSFFKKVKQLTGLTPNEYIRQQRMTVAIELLKDTRLTVAEVAFKVGFEDQYYFSKAFKQYYGMPPTKYRKGETVNQEEGLVQ